jgi:SAM-dependent methyltransferase
MDDSSSAAATPARTIIRAECPLCGADNRSISPRPTPAAPWQLKECPRCALVYLERVLALEHLAETHCWSKSYQATGERRGRTLPGRLRAGWNRLRLRLLPHRKTEASVRKYVGAGALLDVGCGSGKLFERLAESIIPFGIEVDRQAAAAARVRAEKRGGTVLSADARSGLASFDACSMDCVLMRSYLEHENEPLAALVSALRVLRAGGIAIIKVPNHACWNRRLQGWQWPGFRFPDHVNYFTPRTLEQMVTRAGFAVERFSLRDRLPTSDNMWLYARKAA